MDVSRRQFFKICAGGMAGTTVAAMLGFAPKMALAQARNYKLLRAKEIRNTCTYCSVGCGLLMHSLGDGAKNAKEVDLSYRRGPGSSGEPRAHFVRKGAGITGLRAQRKPFTLPGIPRARFRQMAAHQLG